MKQIIFWRDDFKKFYFFHYNNLKIIFLNYYIIVKNLKLLSMIPFNEFFIFIFTIS